MSFAFLQHARALPPSWYPMLSFEQHAGMARSELSLPSTVLWQKDTSGVRPFWESRRGAGETNQSQRPKPRTLPASPDLCSPEGPQEKPYLLVLQSDCQRTVHL